jgi:uncharacterized membrane protein required for colicin V production
MKNLGLNWFDVLTLVMVCIGVYVGRRRGMSSELLDLTQWVLAVGAGAWLGGSLGRFYAQELGVGAVPGYIAAYLTITGSILLVFFLIKRFHGEKLVSADFFGPAEYYLGMIAGPIRFLCIVVFAMALLHAKPVNEQDLAKQIHSQNDSLGAIYFPPFGSIQNSIFKDSSTGRLVIEHAPMLLITADPKAGSGVEREGIARRRERDVYDVIDSRR